MKSSRRKDIEAITCKPARKPHTFDADARANFDAWKQGEPVPSTFYRVGKLIVPQNILRQAAAETDQLPGSCSVDIYHDDDEVRWANESKRSPFLDSFLTICARRLRSFARKDLGDPNARLFTTAFAGPYELHAEDDWHRDFPNKPFGKKYLVTVHGPGTLFAMGDFGQVQFESEMLSGTEPEHVIEAPNNVITLHNESTAAHAAPPEAHNGEGRIFVASSWLYGRK